MGLPVIANPDVAIAEQVPHRGPLFRVHRPYLWTRGQIPTGRANLVMVGHGLAGA